MTLHCSVLQEMASRLVILLSLLSLFSTFTFSKHLLVEVEDGEGLEDEGGTNADAANDADPELDDEDPSAADDKVANQLNRFNCRNQLNRFNC